jgi:hypothetical protein
VIDVALLHDGMALASADVAAIGRGANLALLGDEVIQFAGAEQIAPARWCVSMLGRGLNGSESRDHPAGTRLVLLDRDSLLLPAPGVLRVGDRVRVNAQGVGDVDAPATTETIVTGRSVAPLAPVHLRWAADADGGATVTWVRRSRLGWRWTEGEVPLAEEREAYRVAVTSAVGLRVTAVAEPAISITEKEVAGGGVRVTVSQIGTVATSSEAVINWGNQI